LKEKGAIRRLKEEWMSKFLGTSLARTKASHVNKKAKSETCKRKGYRW
jgi:hypothetical protein